MIFQSYSSSISSLLPSWEACKDAICLRNTRVNIYALNILAISLVVAVSTAVIDLKPSYVLVGGIITLALALYLKIKGSKNTELEKEVNPDNKSQKALFIKEYEDSKETLKTDITNKKPEKIDFVTEKFLALSQKLFALNEPKNFKDSIRTTSSNLVEANNMYYEFVKLKSAEKIQTKAINSFFSYAEKMLSKIEQHVTNMEK